MARPRIMWRPKKPSLTYDVVIIGGGLHGLACAYYLAKNHGLNNVAVLERRRFGYGGSGRNTEVIRANQRAPEILPLYKRAVELWQGLSGELDYNLMVHMPGLIGLAHNEAGLNSIRTRVENGKDLGLETYILTPEEIHKINPEINLSPDAAVPVVGGYFHPPTGTVRHDAAVWGLASAADRLGVDLCPGVEVTGITVESGRVTGVITNHGSISAPVVLNAAGGWSSEICRLAGVKVPMVTMPLQALVTEPVKPFLRTVVVSELYFVYVQQSLKGELVMGSHLDPLQSYSLASSFDFVAHQARFMLEIFPQLAPVKLMRQWTGLCDMCPDSAPVMGASEIDGFYLDVGWGYFGFKSTPACGEAMAEFIATGERPRIIEHLGLERFYTGKLVPETYFVRA